MPTYDRDYDREYEGDYDTEGQEDARLKGGRAADRAFAASLPSAVQVQNSITMGDVSGSTGESYFTLMKGAWQENKRRMIIILSVALILAVVSISLALTIDRKPAPSVAQSAAAPPLATSVEPEPSIGTTTDSTAVVIEDPLAHKQCVGNTLTHLEPLNRNQYICSKVNNYLFGVDAQGDLIWANQDSNFIHKIFQAASTDFYGSDNFMFILGSHGKFEVRDALGNMAFQKQQIYGNEVKPMVHNNQSLPYLSIHADGVVVLKWYNETAGTPEEHNIQKIYPGIVWTEA